MKSVKNAKNVKKNIDWVIHYFKNCPQNIAHSAHSDNPFPYYLCDAHTHGLSKYGDGHEFQMVLDGGEQEISYVLNEIGRRVKSGERFAPGDKVSGIYDDCSVRIEKNLDENGNEVLRVVIPDMNGNYYDEENCDYPYSMQFLSTEEILMLGRLDNSDSRKKRFTTA